LKKILFILLLLPFSAGAQGWQWGRGSTGAGLQSWPVATDPSGNVFTAGFTFDEYITGTAQPVMFGTYTVPISISNDSVKSWQSIIAKYDADGNFLWARGTQNGTASPINIATDQNGNSLLFGSLSSPVLEIGSITLTNTIYPESSYFLAKFDPAGNVLWAITAGNAQGSESFLGGRTFIQVPGTGGIATDAAGNIYITANFHLPTIKIGTYTLTNADPSGNTDDIFVAKYSPSGNVVWAASSGGTGNDDAYGLTVTPAGDIYIAGVFNSAVAAFGPSVIANAGDGTGNAFIAEYNSSGTPVWASGSGGAGGEFALGIASDASNNVYLTGGFKDSSITFSGADIANPYSGSYVLYLVKFNTVNKVSWYKTIGDPTGMNAWGFSMAMSPCGAIWVSGSFGGLLDSSELADCEISIDGHILNIPAGSKDPLFIAGFSTAGAYEGSAALQSGAGREDGIACDGQGNVYLCADYFCRPFVIGSDTLAAIPDSGTYQWQYVAKYTFADVSDPDTFYTHRDTTACTYAGVVLNAPKGYTRYLWDNGSTGTTLTVNAPGTYWVMGIGGCTVIDSITVTDDVSLCACEASLPTAFTPNHDGKDDYFGPLFESGCTISNYSFAIYNRFGQQVFSSENPQAKWDGTFWYINADVGTYMYYVKYTSGPNKTQLLVKGDVTLIR